MNDMTRDDELMGVEGIENVQKAHRLDSDDAVQSRFRRVQSWRKHAADLQRDNRALMMQDHDFYDGEQWDVEDAETLRERGQLPLVFNHIKTPVDWLIGTERKTRVDGRVLPRGKEDSESAEAKTSLMKYVADVNRYEYERSHAWEDAVKAGVGWIEVGIRNDPTEEPIFIRYEDWRKVWYDPLGQDRFVFREEYVDLDMAIAMFPDRADVLKSAAVNSGFSTVDDILDDVDAERDLYDSSESGLDESRSRVKLTECWYKVPCRCQVMRGEMLGPLNGAQFDGENPAYSVLVDEGFAEVFDAIPLRVRCMIYCDGGVLADQESPYRHNRFPFVPIWGYRRKRNNAPYGVIRQNKDAQMDLNKRRSKAQFLLSSNQAKVEDGAVRDIDVFADEKDRPDGVMVTEPGKFDKVELLKNTDLAASHVQLMAENIKFIESGTGVTDEQMGRETNAQSGKAILARQNQGHATSAQLFDNLRLAHQQVGEIVLSLIEQFYTEKKVIRILGDRGNAEYLTLNDEQDDGSVLNDITASKADYIVDQSEFNTSMRQASFESLMNLIGQMGGDPELARALIDLAVDLSDIPGKEEALRRIRQVTGQKDPDADGDSPEEMAAAQQQAIIQQQQQQLQQAMQELELEKGKAKVNLDNANADKARADVRIRTADTLHKIQAPPKEPPTDPNTYAQGQRPAISPYRYPQQR